MSKQTSKRIQSWIADIFFQGSNERAENFVEKFIRADEEKPYKDLGVDAYRNYKDIRAVRMKILQICFEEKNPERRWQKSKKCLIDNLEKIKVDRHIRKTYPPATLIGGLLVERSHALVPVKFVSCCNFRDSKPEIKHPHNVKLHSLSNDPFSWFYYHDVTRIFISFHDGEFEYFDIPSNSLDDYYTDYLGLEYKGKKLKISKDQFFTEYSSAYPDLVRTYRINVNTSPFDILDKTLRPDHRAWFLSSLAGTEGDWKIVTIDKRLDPAKVIKNGKSGRSLNEVSRCFTDINPEWKPDNYLTDFTALKCDAIDAYLSGFSIEERENILIQLLQRFDIDVFEVKSFREIFSLWKSYKAYENLRVLNRVLNEKYSRAESNVSDTDKKYWNIYLDIENMVRYRGCTKKEACNTLQYKYDLSPSGVWTRYKEKQSFVKKNNLTQEDIVRACGLYNYESPKLLGSS